MICDHCHRPLGVTRYIIEGYIGTYTECEYCHDGIDRPSEPELITDSFMHEPPSKAQRSLDAILDKMTGEQAQQ